MNISTETEVNGNNSMWKMFTENSKTLVSAPENSVLDKTGLRDVYKETHFYELLDNFTTFTNTSGHNGSIFALEVQLYNETIFSDYPKELLCFGALCFIVFAVVGIIGNFVSILALSKATKLRNATTAFIVNLCIADLLFCSFSMPLSAVTFIEGKWTYGQFLCKFFPLVRYSNGAVSLFSVIAITVNRYILIVHPKIYPVIYTKRNMVIMIASIWVLSVLLLLPPLLGIWGTLGYDRDVGTCTILPDNSNKSPKMFLYITAFILPSVIFIVCYTRIFFVVRKTSKKSQKREDKIASRKISFSGRKGFVSKHYRHSEMTKSYIEHRERTELRVLRVMLVVFILFIVCYFPVSFVKIFHKEDKLHIMNVAGYLGVYFSNIINPIVYIVMSKEYRIAYKELFCSKQVPK